MTSKRYEVGPPMAWEGALPADRGLISQVGAGRPRPDEPHPDVVGAVLIGGGSRRMGQPKATFEVDGIPMARRVADALLAAGAQAVVIVGGEREVGDRLWLDAVPDRWPGLGPLGGIATAVLDAPTSPKSPPGAEIVVVAPCDLPDLTASAVWSLVAALRAAPPEIVVAAPVTPEGRRHPLPTAWRTSAGPALRALVDGGARRADAGLRDGVVVEVEVDGAAMFDVDEPYDLERRAKGPPGMWRPPVT